MNEGNRRRATAAGCELGAQRPPRCSFYLAGHAAGKINNIKTKATKTVTHVPGRKCYLCSGTFIPKFMRPKVGAIFRCRVHSQSSCGDTAITTPAAWHDECCDDLCGQHNWDDKRIIF